MAKRKVLKITPVLVTLNIAVLLLIVSFYLFRLVKYYRLEQKSKGPGDTVLLVNELLKYESVLDLTKGLVHDDVSNTYIYKGEIDNNYLLYSGMMYRVIGIDSENNIKAVSENNVSMLYSGLENGYNDSYVNSWLNISEENTGIYESALKNSDLLELSYLCADEVDDLANITCNEYNTDNKIVLLSLFDYKQVGGKSSFLNNGESYYLSTLNSEKQNYYITNDGEVGLNQSSSTIYGVRPVITIKSNTKLIKGNGSKNNPYIIEEHKIETLKDVYVNNYVKLDDKVYKVVNVSDSSVRIALNDVLMDNEEKLLLSFSDEESIISNDKDNIGYYLNNTFIKELNKDYIVKSNWFTGKLTNDNLDYKNACTDKVSMNIGMLSLGELFVQDIGNVFTLSRGFEGNIINVIKEDKNVYGDIITSKYNVRPAFNIKADLKIVSGNGSIDSPYELGV